MNTKFKFVDPSESSPVKLSFDTMVSCGEKRFCVTPEGQAQTVALKVQPNGQVLAYNYKKKLWVDMGNLADYYNRL